MIGISRNKQVSIEIGIVRTLGFLNICLKMLSPRATIPRCLHSIDCAVRPEDVGIRPSFRGLGLGVSPLAKEVPVPLPVPNQRDIFGEVLKLNSREDPQFLGDSRLEI